METSKLKRFAQYARRRLIDDISTKAGLVLDEESQARRENEEAVKSLENQIERHSIEQVVERVAYTWFNRFCALRFMDENRYSRISVVSPAAGESLPEILSAAKMGHIDEEYIHEVIRKKVVDLLNEMVPSRNPQSKAYRLLLVAMSNYWHKTMPFLFQRINDYTELLIPDDLLSGNSILAFTREAMPPSACKNVETIGWLYQYYISEKKDRVFADLKKNRKINPESIPAATQLFTPNWIVRYLVENSLGRLWMLNHPDSRLIERMHYYIRPDQPETDCLRIGSPEEIKICDPACGSGHMLTYAFDLLYAIYEEEGYSPQDIPEKILENNLYGIEIDERAGELAAFALTMKAREKQRQFFDKNIKPRICVLEPIHFEQGELDRYMNFIGRELFSPFFKTTLQQFEEADNFGSLIRPAITDGTEVLNVLESRDVLGEVLFSRTHEKVLKILRQSTYLSNKYHAVIANPPYMGSRNMNDSLAQWLKKNYPDSSSDLFSAFIERSLELVHEVGLVAMITMQSWMFLSSFQAFRQRILMQDTILSMAHLGPNAFDSIGGHVVMTAAFVLEKNEKPLRQGGYLRLLDGKSENAKSHMIREAIENPNCGWFYRASSSDFQKIPGSPIAYWATERVRKIFHEAGQLGEFVPVKQGLATADNDQFLRLWFEVDIDKCGYGFKSRTEARLSQKKWFPFNKGGAFRKWYGNNEFLINWEFDGKAIRELGTENEEKPRSAIRNSDFYFLSSITWSFVSSAYFGVRHSDYGAIFDVGGSSAFPSASDHYWVIGYLCSKQTHRFLQILNPTLNFQVGNVASLPILKNTIAHSQKVISEYTQSLIKLARDDWNSYETSWDFNNLPILHNEFHQKTLQSSYFELRSHWQEITMQMKKMEEKNNQLFIEDYKLQNELTPDVPLSEITLTCNPHYRYDDNRSHEELEKLLLADTMRELVSYAVGCMFGRYALEKPGLILANQGQTIEDYFELIPDPLFPADENNVIPVLDGNWFPDDIAERFCQFLRVAFGTENYEHNLRFVEKALNVNDRRNFSMRNYFLSEFYSDHVKYYRKRPVYWMFSSSRGSFNALIYLHRYRPDTVSIVLNDYLREFQEKLKSQKLQLEAVSISTGSSQNEKVKALKEIEKTNKIIFELEEYEREVLYPLATRKINIDLDDGVKLNYPKFGKALKKVHGLSSTKVIQDTAV